MVDSEPLIFNNKNVNLFNLFNLFWDFLVFLLWPRSARPLGFKLTLRASRVGLPRDKFFSLHSKSDWGSISKNTRFLDLNLIFLIEIMRLA